MIGHADEISCTTGILLFLSNNLLLLNLLLLCLQATSLHQHTAEDKLHKAREQILILQPLMHCAKLRNDSHVLALPLLEEEIKQLFDTKFYFVFSYLDNEVMWLRLIFLLECVLCLLGEENRELTYIQAGGGRTRQGTLERANAFKVMN